MKGSMFTECRVLGHSWRPVTVEYQGDNYIQVLRCQYCQTVRRWKLSPTGQPLGNTYAYGDGYQEKDGLKPADKDALRLRYVRARGAKKR